jgi:hypothetical protein
VATPAVTPSDRGRPLGSEDGQELQLAGRLAAGRGGVDDDPQVAAVGGEGVTVQVERAEFGMAAGLVILLVDAVLVHDHLDLPVTARLSRYW